MPRNRKTFLPISATVLGKSTREEPQVPLWVVRAVVCGLAQLTRSAHKPLRTEIVLTFIKGMLQSNLPPLVTPEDQMEISGQLEGMIRRLWSSPVARRGRKHPVFTILIHADTAKDLLAPYPFRAKVALRIEWLHANISFVLNDLRSAADGCHKSCPRCIDLTEEELQNFASSQGISPLADAIVAHYHNISLEYLHQLYYGRESLELQKNFLTFRP